MTDARALLAEGARRLAAAGIDGPRAEARILLEHVTSAKPHLPLVGRSEISRAKRKEFPGGGQRSTIDPHPDRSRDPTSPQGGGEVESEYLALIARRMRHEPVAYITGRREFWSLEFEVGPGVLIPRPETETLVEEAIKSFPDRVAALDILDLGTGTACLPIAFLSEYPNARAVAVDASSQALSWARRNLDKHRLLQRCTLQEGQWTDGLTGTFDIIFSNPPYIDRDTLKTLEPDVVAFEPRGALDGGPDGLDAYRQLAARIGAHLERDGCAIVELGAGQANAVRDIFAAAGLETVRVVPDLSGIDRCLVAARAV